MSDSDSDSIDVAALAQPLDGSDITDMQELNRIHRIKLTAIMRSNALLKAELKQMKKEQHDNYRVKMIKNLRQQLRESQTLTEAVTRELKQKCNMSPDDIGELYDNILAQPKLSKVNNPLKLKKEIVLLKVENEELKRELKERREAAKRREARDAEQPAPRPAMLFSPKQQSSTLHMELLENEKKTNAKMMDIHRDMIDKLKAENRELRQYKMNFDILACEKEKLEHRLESQRRELMAEVQSTEDHHQDLRELRVKLNHLLSVRSSVEEQHRVRVQELQQKIANQEIREKQYVKENEYLRDRAKALENSLKFKKQQDNDPLSKSHLATIHDLQYKVLALQKQNKTQAAMIDSLAHSSSNSNPSLVQQLQQENAVLHNKLSDAERKFIANYHDDRDRLHDMADRDRVVQSQAAQLEGLQQELTKCKNELIEWKDRRHTIEKKESEMKNELDKIKDERKQMHDLLIAKDQQISNLRADLQQKEDDPQSLFPNKVKRLKNDDELDAKQLEQQHLERIAKLMRNFEEKEKEYQREIARLSGKDDKTKQDKKQINIEVSSDEDEPDDDDDDSDLSL